MGARRTGQEVRNVGQTSSSVLQCVAAFVAVRYRTPGTMLPTEKIAHIKAAIADLEKARYGCHDSGIRELIEVWIEAQKKKLRSERSDA